MFLSGIPINSQYVHCCPALLLTAKHVTVIIDLSFRTMSVHAALEEIRSRFRNDRLAMKITGVAIFSAVPGKAFCSLVLEERHMNDDHMLECE